MKMLFKNRENLDIVLEIFAPGRDKLVFIMPGLGGFKEQGHLVSAGEVFINHGYTVIIFDPAHSFGESGGLYEDATMTGYFNDFEDLISWSKSQDWYREPFVVCGHSLGGYSSLAYAEKYPDKVAGVVSLAPVISGEFSHEAHKRYNRQSYNNWLATGWNEKSSNSKPGLIKRLKWSHMEDRLKHDLYPAIGNLTMPVFIVGASQDQSCPIDQIEPFFKQVPSVKKDFKVIPEASHNWRDDHDLGILKRYIDSFIPFIG